eukprot:scaffold158482_cov35-Tisochrysis_lutea.AAC.2
MMVLLGEVGGVEEYQICAAIRDGRLSKPIVAWCIGTCEPQNAPSADPLSRAIEMFGHRGLCPLHIRMVRAWAGNLP